MPAGGEAVISPDEVYRYRLTRVWDHELPAMTWVMLNPSTADAETDDPTIRKCTGFAERSGCGSIIVVNLFAVRARDPRAARRHRSPVGPENDSYIAQAISDAAGPVVVGWGAHTWVARRVRELIAIPGVAQRDLDCYGITRDGHPLHPLMIPYANKLVPWRIGK